MLRYVLFDLDETLYPTSNGLMPALSSRMREYIMAKYALSPEEAHALQKKYWAQYGTTLRGLLLERHIDPSGYLRFVHDVPLEDYLRPDPRLRAVLERIPQEKVILTNADARHAERTLAALGIADQFTRIFDVVFFDYECKPALVVYQRVLAALDARADECALVEDSARNLAPAHELGIKTILVGAEGAAGVIIENIYKVADAIEQLNADPTEAEAHP